MSVRFDGLIVGSRWGAVTVHDPSPWSVLRRLAWRFGWARLRSGDWRRVRAVGRVTIVFEGRHRVRDAYVVRD